jgi:serine/threonine protein kinase
MLSGFDLSLCSDAIAAVESPSYSPDPVTTTSPSHARALLVPLQPIFRSRKLQTLTPNWLFVAKPVSARSCSFVGTHKYVSPEVTFGESHRNAVDWLAFRIFVYEMISGRTPFAAPSNETTLRSIIKNPLVERERETSYAVQVKEISRVRDAGVREGGCRFFFRIRRVEFFLGGAEKMVYEIKKGKPFLKKGKGFLVK